MEAAGSSFPGVQYNDKKIEKGKGELMLMKNFPSFINEGSSQEEVKNYLKSISKSKKVQKPQFHAALSTKFKSHSKEELTKVAENFMNEMGYGEQPFIVVFHNDTENNHVHIVSTRVDKNSGKKINDSFEKLKAQKALTNVMGKLYGVSVDDQLEKLLQYRYQNLKQLELLLERSGFRLSVNRNHENAFDILKNGVVEQTVFSNQLNLNSGKNEVRAKQLKAIMLKYKNLYSNKVFKVEDRRAQESMLPKEKQKVQSEIKPKIEFESEFQKKLRDVLGLDVVFHHKDFQKPFGYTLIDYKTGEVFKGSEILKMNQLFEFTEATIDKRVFESLKDYTIQDEASKQILLKHCKEKFSTSVKDFMLFENKKRKQREVYDAVRNEVKEYLNHQNNKEVKIITSENGEFYAIHERLHFVGKLESLIGNLQYQQFLNPKLDVKNEGKNENLKNELKVSFNDLIFQLKKSSGSSHDPTEEENKKRRKRKKR